MSANVALHEEGACLWVEAACDVERDELLSVEAKSLWVLRHRQGVKIDDTEEILLLVLLFNPAPDGAKVIAEVDARRGLDTAENANSGIFWGCRSHILGEIPREPRKDQNLSATEGIVRKSASLWAQISIELAAGSPLAREPPMQCKVRDTGLFPKLLLGIFPK